MQLSVRHRWDGLWDGFGHLPQPEPPWGSPPSARCPSKDGNPVLDTETIPAAYFYIFLLVPGPSLRYYRADNSPPALSFPHSLEKRRYPLKQTQGVGEGGHRMRRCQRVPLAGKEAEGEVLRECLKTPGELALTQGVKWLEPFQSALGTM